MASLPNRSCYSIGTIEVRTSLLRGDAPQLLQQPIDVIISPAGRGDRQQTDYGPGPPHPSHGYSSPAQENKGKRRVEEWRGGLGMALRVDRPFRLPVPE